MSVPEEPKNSAFATLAEEFNTSAGKFAIGEGGVTLDALMTKYTILQKFKTETPTDKMKLAESLLNCGLDIMRKCAKPGNKDNLGEPSNNVQAIFARLTSAEELPLLPERAMDAMADAALDLIRKSEGMPSYDYNWRDSQNHKTALIKMAQTAIGFAEIIQKRPEKTAGFAAAKAIAPAKRPMLQLSEG